MTITSLTKVTNFRRFCIRRRRRRRRCRVLHSLSHNLGSTPRLPRNDLEAPLKRLWQFLVDILGESLTKVWLNLFLLLFFFCRFFNDLWMMMGGTHWGDPMGWGPTPSSSTNHWKDNKLSYSFDESWTKTFEKSERSARGEAPRWTRRPART